MPMFVINFLFENLDIFDLNRKLDNTHIGIEKKNHKTIQSTMHLKN